MSPNTCWDCRGLSEARSYLFVPGNRPERFAKALASGADLVIIDLEDAVPPAAKEGARRSVAEWLAPGQAAVVLRINASDTPWFAEDLALCRAASPGLAAAMLAKTERPGDLAAIAGENPSLPLIPLIESAAGFDRLREIASGPGVQRLAFGAIDLQLDIGMQGAEFGDLLFFRSQLVLASRLAGLRAPIDSPSTVIEDRPGEEVVAGEARAARRLGFGAKLCIHPRQVQAVNAGLSPGEPEIAWAEQVIAAAAASQGAAVSVDGKMVDRPVILRAEALLRRRR